MEGSDDDGFLEWQTHGERRVGGEYEEYLFLKTYSRTAIYERGNRGMSGMRRRASGQDMKSSAVVSWQQERRENKQSPIDPLIANSLSKGGNPTLLFRTHRPLNRNLFSRGNCFPTRNTISDVRPGAAP